MALLRCPDCGGAVSSSARVCPRCGWKVVGGHRNQDGSAGLKFAKAAEMARSADRWLLRQPPHVRSLAIAAGVLVLAIGLMLILSLLGGLRRFR